MKGLTIGRLFLIYLFIQIAFVVLGCKGTITSPLIEWLPTIITAVIIAFLIVLLTFLSKFYKYGKSKWIDK